MTRTKRERVDEFRMGDRVVELGTKNLTGTITHHGEGYAFVTWDGDKEPSTGAPIRCVGRWGMVHVDDVKWCACDKRTEAQRIRDLCAETSDQVAAEVAYLAKALPHRHDLDARLEAVWRAGNLDAAIVAAEVLVRALKHASYVGSKGWEP